jgi:cell division protein FtsI (penicillin-binding protein 3)
VDSTRKSRRRLTVTLIALIAVVSVFVVRLVDIQVVQAEQLTEQSVDKRSIAVTTYGVRGDIVDTNGVVLADSVERYDITASPRYSQSDKYPRDIDGKRVYSTRDELIQELAVATGEPFDEIKASLDADPESDFAYVSKNTTLEVRTAVRDLHIGWVTTQTHPARTYPRGAIAGNLVGFLGTDGPQTGLEVSENACVGSTNGSQTYERGEDGVRLPGSTVVTEPATDGGVLRLTINSDFQWFVQQELAAQAQKVGAEWGTAMVVRVKDGHLMAAADYPSVDPNDVNGVDAESLGSRAFTAPYEPGSTFKAMTAAMLIDAGKITQTTGISAPPSLSVGGGTITDVFSHPTMRWTTTGVLVNSSNIGISVLSEELSPEKRYKYMKKFGLGQKTGVEFLGEDVGLLNPVSQWDPITEKAVAFGQGVSVTSAQVASIYQTLGNHGVRMPLTLVEGCELPDGTITDLPSTEGKRAVSEKAADDTVEMLENVVTQGSLSSVLTIPGYNIAAKTGTAEVAEGGVYGDDRVVSVAGLISSEEPEYAVVVTLGKPTTIKTSSAAAPAFRNIMSQVIKTFRVEPPSKAVPELPVAW